MRTFWPAYASGKWYVMACKQSTQPVSARWVYVGLEDSRAHVVLAVVLKFFGRHGRSEEVLQVCTRTAVWA